MKELAPGVWQLRGTPPDLVNTYLVEDVLIDSGTRFDGGRILEQLRGRAVSAHALTHAHSDHLGSSDLVCDRLGIPFWVSADDAAAAADPELLAQTLIPPPLRRLPYGDTVARMALKTHAGPCRRADRELHEGDEVAGFQVLHVPGHTPGHLAFWRESDRVLIIGDVVWNFHFFGGRPGMTEPLSISCSDPAQNRASARRLAALEPALICFGHGPPLADPQKFTSFVASLPQ